MTKKLGIGAIVSFQCKFIHPHRLRDSKYPNLTTGKRLTDAVFVQRALKRIKHKETVCVVVHHDNFKDDKNGGGGGGYLEIWCTESHVRIEKEGDINLFFEADHCSSRRDNNNDGSLERDNITKEENYIAEKNKFEESNDAEEDGSLEKEKAVNNVDVDEKKNDQPLATVLEVFSFAKSTRSKVNLAIGLFASVMSGVIQPGKI